MARSRRASAPPQVEPSAEASKVLRGDRLPVDDVVGLTDRAPGDQRELSGERLYFIDSGATGRRGRANASVRQSEHDLPVVVQDQVYVLLGQSALADVVERLLVRLERHQHRVVAPRDEAIRAEPLPRA